MQISAADVKRLREKTGAGMMDCKNALVDAEGDEARATELLRERGLARAAGRSGRATSEGAIAMSLDGCVAGIVELGCETDFVAKTDEFQALAEALAGLAAGQPEAGDAAALLSRELEGRPAQEHIAEAAAKLGENLVLKRCGRVALSGPGLAGGYIHAGGKLGVVVALESEAEEASLALPARDLAMHVAAADPPPLAVDRDGVDAGLVKQEAEIFRKQAAQEGKPEKVLDRIVEGRINKFYAEVCLLEQPFVKDPDKTVQQVLADVGAALGKPVAVSAFVRFRLGESADE